MSSIATCPTLSYTWPIHFTYFHLSIYKMRVKWSLTDKGIAQNTPLKIVQFKQNTNKVNLETFLHEEQRKEGYISIYGSIILQTFTHPHCSRWITKMTIKCWQWRCWGWTWWYRTDALRRTAGIRQQRPWLSWYSYHAKVLTWCDQYWWKETLWRNTVGT